MEQAILWIKNNILQGDPEGQFVTNDRMSASHFFRWQRNCNLAVLASWFSTMTPIARLLVWIACYWTTTHLRLSVPSTVAENVLANSTLLA